VNAGAFVQTSTSVPQGQTVGSAATIQLKGQDITAWQQASWEVFSFPPNWTGPSGGDWSYDSVRNLYVSRLFQPSLITLPSTASIWSKWITRLVVNNGVGPGVNGIQYSDVGQPLPSNVLDISGAWQTLSPNQALQDVGLFEGSQFGGYRAWVLALQTAVRSIDSIVGAVLGNAAVQTPTSGGDTNYQITGTQGNIIVPITAFTAPRTWTMPRAPTLGMAVTIPDARKLYTSTNKLTLTTAGGTDLFYVDGTKSTPGSPAGSTYVVNPNLYQGGSITLVRMSATTWETTL
jgi:hypothetical protein